MENNRKLSLNYHQIPTLSVLLLFVSLDHGKTKKKKNVDFLESAKLAQKQEKKEKNKTDYFLSVSHNVLII